VRANAASGAISASNTLGDLHLDDAIW